jgi:acetylornithine deacetylase/succinyl-diaminopimelate desuccinylase-like protein
MNLAAPPTFYSHGALDAGYFCAKGAEATMWGPGDMDQWHSEDERISVDELQCGAQGYFGLIREYLC